MLRKLKCIFLSYEGVQEQYAEENIWTQEGGCNGGWKKLCSEELHYWLSLPASMGMGSTGG